MKFISRIVRKQTLLSNIVPALFLIFLVFTAWNYPFSDIFSPKHIAHFTDMEGEYTSRQDYVNLTDVTLYYTGYDSVSNDKVKGRYYYALEGDQCFFFLLTSEDAMKAPESLNFPSLNLRLVQSNSDFSSFLDSLSTDIDWSATHLSEATPTFFGREYRDILYYSYFFAGLLTALFVYIVIVLCSNILVFIFPFLQKGMLPCSGFSAKKKLFSRMIAKTLKERDDIVAIRFSSRGRKDFYVSPSFLIYCSTYDTHILPVKDIIWIYKHVIKAAHGISDASSFYTIHFILNNGRHIQFKNCPERNSDALIALLAGKNPNILVGYSQEHKALAKKYLTYINTTQ